MSELRILVRRLDHDVDRAFDLLRGRRPLDALFYRLSEAANHSLLWHGIALARGLLSRRHRRSIVRMSVTLAVESALVNGPIKGLFGRERPVVREVRTRRLRSPKTSSFPSGHATSAFCAASILSHDDPDRKPFYYGLACLVAGSRIHVRIHHASDVMAGVLIGIGLGRLACLILDRVDRAESERVG